MIKTRYSTLVLACLTAALPLVAQEPAIISAKRLHEVIPAAKVANATPTSRQWFDERIDPIQRERRLIREARAAEARRNAVGNAKKSSSSQVRFGNTAYENWSPYPDRELDARTLSFPMSKSSIQRNEAKKAAMQQMKNIRK